MVDINQLIQDAQLAQSKGDNDLALSYYQQVLFQHPDEPSLLTVCGNLCVKLARYKDATGYFRRLFTIKNSPEVRNALCYALQAWGNEADKNGRFSQAEACFEEALQHQPEHASYWYNLGNAQRELGKYSAALTSFLTSIQINPNDADTYNNLGNVQRELGLLNLAIESYNKALSINPNLHHALTHLIHQKQHICDWRGQGDSHLDQQILKVRHLVNTVPEAQISPFAFLAMPSTTAEEQKICASHYLEQHYRHLYHLRASLALATNHAKKPKIKVGYLSADFRLHPLAFLITELIEQHDRNHFEVTAYSYGVDDKTPTRKRLEEAFDHFVNIRELNDIEAATKINQDQIDILVDLTGYTQSSRTGIVALKPASTHINWLGFPGTMGEFNLGIPNKSEPLFDYVLADTIIAPNKSEFSEEILYLPCYQPNIKRECKLLSKKSDHHLPENSVVFCCFNQTFKIAPDVFAVWMRILKQVPNSVLWLLECNQWAKANLEKEATEAGVDKNRLIFAPRTYSEAHLERQRHADLFLDTLPYNAHTTASDALWAGLPILTCMGNTFCSRVTASLLTHIGLPSLICDSLTTYEEKALYFGQHPDALANLKATLKPLRESADLFNAEKFARLLEAQYQFVWQTQRQNSSLSR